jgi:hypothetical protein
MRPLVYLRAALALSLFFGGVRLLATHPQKGLPGDAGRIHLAPRFSAGQTLRYQIDSRTRIVSHGSGAVENPQGGAEIELLVNAVVRLEVLETSKGAPQGVRVRANYEKCSALVRGDSYDPAAAALAAQYHRLEGKSVEFTVDAQGKIEDVQGLSELLGDERASAAARSWFTGLGAGANLPPEGIAPGQTWSSKRDVADAPLAGTILEAQSAYSRNESCAGDAGVEAGGEICAVILTRTEMRQKAGQRNQTPEALRRRGMRSSGSWSSSAESLAYVSLRTGLEVSTTQSGTEEIDLTLQRVSGDPPFHYTARVRTETHITLLPEAPKL